MKKLLLLMLLFANINCTNSNTVYVCDSSNAKRYHYKATCGGLGSCTHKIVKTTLAKAKSEGKTLCEWEK